MSASTTLFQLTDLLVTLMYIVPIAWLYVALMMSAAEASNSNGTIFGAVITFLLYGLLPVALVAYIMATPARKRARRAREAAQPIDHPLSGDAPDTGGHASTDPLPTERKEG